jgi:hypothetical protein
MKEINPVQIWKNGEIKLASYLDAYIVNDNLSNSCTFFWMLKEQSETGLVLSDGNVTMSGTDYDNWDGSSLQAYEYIAGKINVILK